MNNVYFHDFGKIIQDQKEFENNHRADFQQVLQSGGGGGNSGGMEARVAKLEDDVKALDGKFDAVMKKLDRIDDKFDKLNDKIDGVKDDVRKLETSLKDDVKRVEVSVANLQRQALILKWLLTPVVAGVIGIFIKMFLP